MTKISEENEFPENAAVERAHQDIEQNASKFLNALESYQDSNSEDKARLKVVMDQSLNLIKAAVSEIKRAGIYKQEVKVEKDYEAYMKSGGQENLSALEQDLGTLRDYNKL